MSEAQLEPFGRPIGLGVLPRESRPVCLSPPWRGTKSHDRYQEHNSADLDAWDFQDVTSGRAAHHLD